MSEIFKGKKQIDKQKLRGGYYTPSKLADYLVEWAIRRDDDRVLEPSCGDGNFIVSAIERLNGLGASKACSITAVEIVQEEICKACHRAAEVNVNNVSIHWHSADFFRTFCILKHKQYNVVIGNPPFIRFQYFDDDSRNIAFELLREASYNPTKLANAWAAFVQLSIEILAPEGRLAMVVPAELLQVNYASELRDRITRSFKHVILVTFKKLVFSDIQQEVVLLLAEGKRSSENSHSDVHTIEIENEADLKPSITANKIAHAAVKHTRPGMKWTSFFLSEEEFKVLDKAQKNKKLKHLGELAQVDIGIVTGRNSFFVIDAQTVEKYQLKKYVIPLVGKTSAINSLLFDRDKFDKYAQSSPAYLLSINCNNGSKLNKGLLEYIALGEKEKVHEGFKCRVRKCWYEVPSVYVPEGFLFRQIHKYPLLVVNEAKAACTDTIHRVRVSTDIDFKQVVTSFVNSLTLAWSEVCGRSYGGGVLELEPRESEELPIPFFDDVKLDFAFVNKCLEESRIEDALDYVDKELLMGKLGLKRKEVLTLRRAWKTLSERRINRK